MCSVLRLFFKRCIPYLHNIICFPRQGKRINSPIIHPSTLQYTNYIIKRLTICVYNYKYPTNMSPLPKKNRKTLFWTSLHFFWTWTLLLDLTTILLEMATLLLDLHTLLTLPSCSAWAIPPFGRFSRARLHRNSSDSRALELH